MTNVINKARCIGIALSLVGLYIATPSYAYNVNSPYYNSEKSLESNTTKAIPAFIADQIDPNLSPEEQEALKNKIAMLTPNRELENAELVKLEKVSSSEKPVLLIYGGYNYNYFLGCLNCMPQYRISIWNAKGPYGSYESSHSIWNRDFEYGNPLSRLSPWNKFAGNPPLIVDVKGNLHGKFTNNGNLPKQFRNNFMDALYYYHDKIGPKSQEWFSSIFKTDEGLDIVPLSDMVNFPKPPKPQNNN